MTRAEYVCLRKRRYPSQYEANRTALYEMSLCRAPSLRSYWCPLCGGGWHLTKKASS